jgi:hypothetical protein
MQKTLTCACGAVLVARSDEDLLTAVEEHLDASHDVLAHRRGAEGRQLTGANERVAALMAAGRSNPGVVPLDGRGRTQEGAP